MGLLDGHVPTQSSGSRAARPERPESIWARHRPAWETIEEPYIQRSWVPTALRS